MAVLRPPADCTASAWTSTSDRCVASVASKRAGARATPPRTSLHHALPGRSAYSLSPPLLDQSRPKPHPLKASVAELETAVPSADPMLGGQRSASSVPQSAVHPIELPQGLRDMVRVCPRGISDPAHAFLPSHSVKMRALQAHGDAALHGACL